MGKNRKPGGSQKPKSAFKIGQKPKTAAQNQKPDLKMGKNRNPPNYSPPPSGDTDHPATPIKFYGPRPRDINF